MLTLESYRIVFAQLNAVEDGQRKPWGNCLGYFSPGLFSFYQFSKLDVKIKFLELITNHYITMGKELLHCLYGLLTCLIAGLDDQNSEAISKTEKLLSEIEKKVGTRTFYGTFWQVIALLRM